MSKQDLQQKVDEVFLSCSSAGPADFRNVAKTFWSVLDNKVSVVDLAGIFTMSVTGNGVEALNSMLFAEFFSGIARIKYPTGADYCEKLLEDLKNAKGLRIRSDLPLFTRSMDKNVVRVLLKYDMPLRRCFSGFAGQTINVGGGLTWDEVRKRTIGMEVSLFLD